MNLSVRINYIFCEETVILYDRANDPERPQYPDRTLNCNLKPDMRILKSSTSSSDLQNDNRLDLADIIFDITNRP